MQGRRPRSLLVRADLSDREDVALLHGWELGIPVAVLEDLSPAALEDPTPRRNELRVARAQADLESRGLIRPVGKQIEIIDLAALETVLIGGGE